MSLERFQENCRGCKPVLISFETGTAMPDDHPAMKAIFGVWDQLSKLEKEAWHAFTCQNSREPQVLDAVNRLNQKFQAALKAAE